MLKCIPWCKPRCEGLKLSQPMCLLRQRCGRFGWLHSCICSAALPINLLDRHLWQKRVLHQQRACLWLQGRMVLLLGPPGGGKTTLLNALAGKLRSGGGLRVRGLRLCIPIAASTRQSAPCLVRSEAAQELLNKG